MRINILASLGPTTFARQSTASPTGSSGSPHRTQLFEPDLPEVKLPDQSLQKHQYFMQQQQHHTQQQVHQHQPQHQQQQIYGQLRQSQLSFAPISIETFSSKSTRINQQDHHNGPRRN